MCIPRGDTQNTDALSMNKMAASLRFTGGEVDSERCKDEKPEMTISSRLIRYDILTDFIYCFSGT